MVVGADGLSGTYVFVVEWTLLRSCSGTSPVNCYSAFTTIPMPRRRCLRSTENSAAGANVRRIATVMTWWTGSLVAQTWKSSASVYVLVFVR